ncbi:ATP-binding cassette domain-containing protein [Pseudomonas sp. K5002]|uniref:ATP-binding cassette domain-containing protein n=1 Tax=Pseudomonas sp. K5002 TaxID=2738828 RepID=UPI0021167E6D
MRQGEIVGLAGLNGAGRSTLLKALFGVGRNDSDVELFGQPYQPQTSRQAIRQGVGLVPENRKTEGLLLDAPIYRNACLVHTRHLNWFSHRQAKDRAGPVLQRLQTKLDNLEQPVRQLSGGNQQKVVMAKWVIDGARLLLLDEPLGALDALTRIEMQQLIENLWQKHGFTVLLVTHDVSEAVAIADRVILIEDGEIGLDLHVELPRPRVRGSHRLAALETEVLNRVLSLPGTPPEPEPVSPLPTQLRWAQ